MDDAIKKEWFNIIQFWAFLFNTTNDCGLKNVIKGYYKRAINKYVALSS